MGSAQEEVARALLVGALLLATAAPAAADPLFESPRIGKVNAGGGDRDATLSSLTIEARLLGILGADRLAAWPDLRLGLEQQEPRMVALRAGGVLWLTRVPLGFVLQVDFAESARPKVGGEALWTREPGAFVGAFVDDLYMAWRPARAAQLVLGRARVPFGKQRQWDERDLPLGGVPFVVDRTSPDRRWGLMLHGDLGAMSYAAGAWEDLDVLEPRAGAEDPSLGGTWMALGHLEWTPVAPMYGSNPVGKVHGARGPLPTPRADPWFATTRVSLGLGALVRGGDDGLRTDVSFSTHVKWRWLALAGEVLVGVPADGGRELGAWGEAHVTPLDKLSLSTRVEWDGGEGAAGAWSAGGGVMWHATKDRRSRIGVVGWVKEDRGDRRREDAMVVLVQTAL